MSFRSHRYEQIKARAVAAEQADRRKEAAALWREAMNLCGSQKDFFDCHDRHMENWNAYNAKFKPEAKL